MFCTYSANIACVDRQYILSVNGGVDDFRIVSERIKIRHETVENFKHDPNQILVHVQLVVSAFVAERVGRIRPNAFRLGRVALSAKALSLRGVSGDVSSDARMLAMTPARVTSWTRASSWRRRMSPRERMMKIKLPANMEMMRSLYG